MFLEFPDGLVWRMMAGVTERLRRRKFESFMGIVRPTPEDSLLDVGVSGYIGRATDFLEMWYPYRERITALGNDDSEKFNGFREKYPTVKVVVADGCRMPYPDDAFDVVFSNAVVEHVGSRERQKGFVHECVRVAKRGFLTTPNYGFPLESHTMLPFVHFMPDGIKHRVYRAAGKEMWCDEGTLNLLTEKDFLSMFPADVKISVYRQSLIGMTATIWIYFEKESLGPDEVRSDMHKGRPANNAAVRRGGDKTNEYPE